MAVPPCSSPALDLFLATHHHTPSTAPTPHSAAAHGGGDTAEGGVATVGAAPCLTCLELSSCTPPLSTSPHHVQHHRGMELREGEEAALKTTKSIRPPEKNKSGSTLERQLASMDKALPPMLSQSPLSSKVKMGRTIDAQPSGNGKGHSSNGENERRIVPDPQGVEGLQPSNSGKRKKTTPPTKTLEVGKRQPNNGEKDRRTVPDPQGVDGLQSSNSKKRKRATLPTSRLEIEKGKPINREKETVVTDPHGIEGLQSSNSKKRKRTTLPASTPKIGNSRPSRGERTPNPPISLEIEGADPTGASEIRAEGTSTRKGQPSIREKQKSTEPHPQGVIVQTSSRRKRKRTSPLTSGKGQSISVEKQKSIEPHPLETRAERFVQSWSTLEASDGLEGDETGYVWEGDETGDGWEGDETGDGWEGDETGDGWEGDETGDGWEGDETNDGWEGEDMDEDHRAGCVEGRIDPEMVDNFLHGEDNRKFRSKVWNEFSKIRVAGIVTKGECIHCKAEISAKRGAGTSAMSTHLKRCKARKSVTNVARQLKSAVMSPEGVALGKWRFSQDVSRRELCRMITLHGFPLAIVDYDGVRRFISSLNPVFKMISRRTISTDTLKAFEDQKKLLQDVFKNNNSRVSLTMDMWTSNQTKGYMCITGHFIDDNWKVQKRIINFVILKTPHTGVAMFNAVLKCMQEWNIENKLFSITLDNASNNNSMVKLLKSNLLEKKMLCVKGKLLHHRCGGHVLNLACKAGFEVINPIVHKVRESVKFIEGSTSRKQKFEEMIHQLGISYQKRPNLDVSTRWNSTYLMLEACLQLRKAFESLSKQEAEYTYAPSPQEWGKAQMVCALLKPFYDATMVILGSNYPTANMHFHEIWDVKVALENATEVNPDLLETIQYMQRKFKRYWKLTWLQILFPVIFDPRFKLAFVNFRLKQSFGNEAESKITTMKKVLLDLFKDYSQVNLGSQDMRQHTASTKGVTNAISRYADWDHHISCTASSTSEMSSELELETYLAKPPIPRSDTFDILAWWKSNSTEYPTLSCMARDVLVVPASTVASESAFSMGRRIISDFRSRLSPKTVEALICLQDWIRASGSSQFLMEGIDDYIGLHDQHE